MSDLVSYSDELITYQTPGGVNVYKVSGDLELIGSTTAGKVHYDLVDPEIATVSPHRRYDETWDNGNVFEDNANVYAFKVNHCELERNIGPYGSSGTGTRSIPTGMWNTYEDYTGKVKDGSYFNLRYNDSATFNFNLDWSAVLIPCTASVGYGTYAYMYRNSDFMHESGSTAKPHIYTASIGVSPTQTHTHEGGQTHNCGGYNIPVAPANFNLAYSVNAILTDTSRLWYEKGGEAPALNKFENYQDARMPLYVFQIFGATNSLSYEWYSAITASGGHSSRPYSYSALKMWGGPWSATMSAIDVPEFIRY